MDIICFKTKHAVPKLSRSVIEDFFTSVMLCRVFTFLSQIVYFSRLNHIFPTVRLFFPTVRLLHLYFYVILHRENENRIKLTT